MPLRREVPTQVEFHTSRTERSQYTSVLSLLISSNSASPKIQEPLWGIPDSPHREIRNTTGIIIPFLGKADREFAFAHNGVLFNDSNLRKEKKLPPTCIETDSYVAVQLIERQGTLDFESLKSMAEDVQGNFTFTLLDEENTLYFVKGSSPMYLIYFEMLGLYIYASTESIMKKALKAVGLHKYKFEEIPVHEEDILSIDINGNIARSEYESYRYSIFSDYYNPYDNYYTCHEELLLEMCSMFGVDEEDVLLLLEYGYRADEVEDMLMDTVLLHEALQNIKYEDTGYYSEYCRGVV